MCFRTSASALLTRIKKLAAPVFSADLAHWNMMLCRFTLPDVCQITTALKHNADERRQFIEQSLHRPAQTSRRAEIVRSIPD